MVEDKWDMIIEDHDVVILRKLVKFEVGSLTMKA